MDHDDRTRSRPARSTPESYTVNYLDMLEWLGAVNIVSLLCLVLAGISVMGLVGCKDLAGTQELPAGTTNPSFYNTKQGAVLERNAALTGFFNALTKEVIDVGLLTDELQDASTGASSGVLLTNANTLPNPLDERILNVANGSALDGSFSYGYLQRVRGLASQAIGMLATYDTATTDLESQKIMRAELYALGGYSEVMLADLFCSGVPLSTLDFQRDYTYHAGSSTTDVYNSAVAMFDTALTLADTSTQVQYLARVGMGRARLNLGQYTAAADDVQSVPDGFMYQISGGSGTLLGNVWTTSECPKKGEFERRNDFTCLYTMSDMEGGNGLPFLSVGDPRSAGKETFLNTQTNDSMYFPVKYQGLQNSGILTLTVASGVEARLIQAENALHNRDASWLTILKTMHDTLPGVAALDDPGPNSSNTDSARVALLFKERAEWLYLTGSRQGDLRRLLRQYGQYWNNDPDRVYPTGAYLGIGLGRYGTDVAASIPQSELVNPLFHGCLNRAP